LDKFIRYTSVKDLNDLILYNASNIYPVDLKRYGIEINSDKFEYRQKVIKEGLKAYPGNPVRATMFTDLYTHMASILDRNDRMTMGASIECRVPFLDHRMIEMGANLPNNKLLTGPKGKYILFNSIAKKLPQEIRNFRKVGFSVPWEEYLQKDPAFKQEIEEMMSSDLFKMGVFERININELYKEFHQDHHLSKSLFRQFFMLHIWYKHYYQTINK
jgi:asparagine synthase (glutamine-hydrolysing)